MLLDFRLSARMPVVALVPAFVNMVENVWPQLFAFWKKPITPL